GRRLVLQIAPARACRSLGLGGGGDLGLGRRYRLLFGLDLAPHGLEFGLDIGEAGFFRPTAPPPPPPPRRAPESRPPPQRPPSRDTRRWPGLSIAMKRAASSRLITPICARRRASCFGALT